MRNPDDQSVTLLLRGIMSLGRRLRAERPAGSLSLSNLGILGTLNRHGPMVARNLALAERLQPQSLTRLLAELERAGLINRTRSESDRREILIKITAKGRRELNDDMAVRRAWLDTTMQAMLTAAEVKALLASSLLMLKLAAYEPLTS